MLLVFQSRIDCNVGFIKLVCAQYVYTRPESGQFEVVVNRKCTNEQEYGHFEVVVQKNVRKNHDSVNFCIVSNLQENGEEVDFSCLVQIPSSSEGISLATRKRLKYEPSYKRPDKYLSRQDQYPPCLLYIRVKV